MEDIEANNYQVNAVLDTETGAFVFKVLMKSFEFEKALMQEHFNENYVESERFPKCTVNGSITNNADVDYSTPGTYKVQVVGELTIHGTSQAVSAEGSVEVTGTGIIARTKFMLNPEERPCR